MYFSAKSEKWVNSYSDDTLASFCRPFLVPVDWYQELVSVSYFAGARNQHPIEHVQFGAQNRVESWPVIGQSEQMIALFVCEQKWKMNWSEESICQLIEQYENS